MENKEPKEDENIIIKRLPYSNTKIRYCWKNKKVAYKNKKEILQAIESMKNKGKQYVVNLGVYKCPVCGYYHLTKAVRKFNI